MTVRLPTLLGNYSSRPFYLNNFESHQHMLWALRFLDLHRSLLKIEIPYRFVGH